MRVLSYVPIVHSEADLGALGQAVSQRLGALYGAERSQRQGTRQLSIDAMWDAIRTRLLAMPTRWDRVRVYQDGLPMCGFEPAIVQELAGKGSRNYALLLELAARGAELMGTEDPRLLVREYQRVQRLVELTKSSPIDPAAVQALKREGDQLLAERDAAIAARVLSTLQAGEHGILFIGLLHRVDEVLGEQLRVEHVIQTLPLGAEPRRNVGAIGEP